MSRVSFETVVDKLFGTSSLFPSRVKKRTRVQGSLGFVVAARAGDDEQNMGILKLVLTPFLH